MQAMDCAPEIITYSEGAAPFFDTVLLRPLDVVENLRRRSVFPVIALKPICETHRVHELLECFPRSRAVWIFRSYQDAVSSASLKWKSGREAVRRLASANPESAGWRLGGLSVQRLQLVRDLYSDQMTLHEANAVMWYLRNSLFFDLRAHEHPDVLLVRYEDFTARPVESFARMFRFIEVPLPSAVDGIIRDAGRSTSPTLEISDVIRDLCDGLHERLLTFHRQHISGSVGTVAAALTREHTVR